jgi:ABC-type transport system involved in multi-copper enzyme maturation permease subunit
MGDDKSKSSLLPISGVLIILAALGVTIFTQPFKGTRPFVPELRESYEKVNARLWQDPFRAVLDSVKDGKEPEIDGEFDIHNEARDEQEWKPLKSLTSKRAEKKTMKVLGVMVPGAPYAEDTEMRMRLRYATLSGLGRVGFIPDDAEHVGFIKIAPAPKITLSNIMPFEWLTYTEDGKEIDSVLVVWINDSIFQKTPLLKLARLAGYLEPPKILKRRDGWFKIIGPATSTPLREMVREVFRWDINQTPIEPLQGVEIYSAMATVDNTLLLKDSIGEKLFGGKEPDKIVNWLKTYGITYERTTDNKLLLKDSMGKELSEDKARDTIKEWFRGFGIDFRRTIGVDGGLAAQLIKELNLRRVDLVDESRNLTDRIKQRLHLKYKNHLVLVAEWDTYYGRSFHDVFIEAAMKKGIPFQEREKEKQEIARRIHRISYLRGIDGSLPGEKEDKKEEKAEAKSDPLKDIKSLEQPIGKSQYDYLRRLAEETYDLNKTLQANGGEITAIGVVGTDFYDKFLVLQALRQRFPDVIFFTTDLDARFLHPDNIKWTRNLVVASNFDLSLRKDPVVDDQRNAPTKADRPDRKTKKFVDIQGEVPPFRDNYQTSFFLTVLQAFSSEPYAKRTVNDQNVKELIGKELEPLIFEIGRHQAFVLTDTTGTIHPQKHQVGGGIWFYIKIAFIIIFALIFLFFTSARVNNYVKQLVRDENKVIAVIGVLLLIIVFAVAIRLISDHPDEEPFSIVEGISIWPTEIFRFVGILLSVLFLYLSYSGRKKNIEDIDKKFHFREGANGPSQGNDPTNEPKTGRWAAILNWLRNVAQLEWEPGGGKQEVPLKVLWDEYSQRDSEPSHVRRVIIMVISYLLFCALIVTFDMPVSPVRGTITSAIDKILVAFSVISFVALLSYVFDVTRRCRKFIVAVSNECSKRSHEKSDKALREQINDQLTFVRLIAMRTDAVGKLIFYPFIVWLVMFISRFDYFDNWRTPLGLAVVISLGALYAWTSAFLLRQSAESARTCVADHLKDLLFFTLKDKKPNSDRIKQIESVLGEVRSIKQGAFAPFTQHPLVQSLLVPFGGVGGIYLIEFLTKMNI